MNIKNDVKIRTCNSENSIFDMFNKRFDKWILTFCWDTRGLLYIHCFVCNYLIFFLYSSRSYITKRRPLICSGFLASMSTILKVFLFGYAWDEVFWRLNYRCLSSLMQPSPASLRFLMSSVAQITHPSWYMLLYVWAFFVKSRVV